MGYIGAGISKFNTADTLTVSGDANVTGTVNPTGDTAAGDDAAIGFTSTEGLILTGQGSTSDITVKNDADATVFTVPTGTDDILFPDDAKILVGSGSDLQIYHNGSNSFIDEAGTGDLFIRSNSGVNINKYTGETMIYCVPDGAVNLYHNNAAKFATTATGVDVTGIITTDGVESTCAAGDSNQALLAYHPTSTSSRTIAKFQSNVGGTQTDKVVIKCNGNVGIGTASPNNPLEIGHTGSAGAGGLRIGDPSTISSDTGIYLRTTGDAVIGAAGGEIVFDTNMASVERFRITDNGVTFNGDTAAANALDDYEEGSWSLTLNGGLTPTITYAAFTKIGNKVFLNAYIQIPSNSSSTTMVIAGLPYASVSDGACSVSYTTSTVDNLAILVQGSGVYVYKDTPSVNVTLAEFSGKYLLFAGHYTAA